MECLGCCTCGEDLQCATCGNCHCCRHCPQIGHTHDSRGKYVATARPADLFSASNDGVVDIPYTTRGVRFASTHDGYDTSSSYEGVEMSRVGQRERDELRDSSDSINLASRRVIAGRMTAMERGGEMNSGFDTGSDDNVPIGVDPETHRADLNAWSQQFVRRSIGKLGERVDKMRADVELQRKAYEQDEETLRVVRDIPELRAEIMAQTPVQAYVAMRRATILAVTAGAESRPDTLVESESKLSSTEISDAEKTEVSEGNGKG